MISNRKKIVVLIAGIATVFSSYLIFAECFQDYYQFRRRRYFDEEAISQQRNGVPMWERDTQFKEDVFTFARIKYSSAYIRWGRPDWAVDWPDADLNLSYRLQELTSMKVAPEGVVVKLTDPEIFDYPFTYLIEPGAMNLTEEEVIGMRKYLERGGFIMVDDFWGEHEWSVFEDEMKRVLPGKDWIDLPLSHEIFHIVYDLKEKPQIPSISHYYSGATTERLDAQEPHYRAYLDDDGRIMVMVCHNTDLGDGWEREGMDQGYFKTYSERWAYPLGINIVTYALTH